MTMEYIITFAQKNEEDDARHLLNEIELDISGDINDHVLVKQNEEICAAAKIVQTENRHYHLEVFGVRNELQNTGMGGFLLDTLITTPWQYCRSETAEVTDQYIVTTVPMKEASAFYKKHGFKPCGFEMLQKRYFEQCETCSERDICNPVPMIYVGGEKE